MDEKIPKTLHIRVHVHKKTGQITIGNTTKPAQTNGTVFDLCNDDVFEAQDSVGRLKKVLHALSIEKKFNLAQLYKYLVNTRQIRPKQLTEVLDVPPYITKLILLNCVRFDGLILNGYHYVKTALFAEALVNFETTTDREDTKFIPKKENITDAKIPEEETWEGWYEMEENEDGDVENENENEDDDVNNGLQCMVKERERIKNAINLKGSVRKLLLAQADRWIKKKQAKSQKARGTGPDALIREHKLSEAKEKAEKKTKKKTNEEIEYDDEPEDPALVRKHFRKKKVGK